MKNLLVGFGLLLLSINVSAQQVAKGFTAANSQWVGFLEYKPTDYNVNLTTKYPLIIFLHGIGERGNGTSQIWSVASNGIPKYIQAGNPMRFYWNGKWETFLVLSPQLSTSYIDWVNFYTEELVAYAKTNLRIDTNRIFVTGLSLGGGGAWRYSTGSLANAQAIAAVAPVCGTCSGITYSHIATANLPLWAFHATNDGTVGVGCTTSQVAGVEMYNPAIWPIMTLYTSGGHGIWDRAYDTVYNWQNPNIYEWFLGQDKSLAPNILPVAYAGPNVTISTSSGTVNLSGAGSTDADGVIRRFIWRKLSGPAAGTITTPVSTNGLTSVTGLTTPGTYVYEVKVVDDRANWTTANVTVTVVNGAVSNIPPIATAGLDQTTLTSTANLNGSSSYDPDGNIVSYQWTKISGPLTYSISNPNVAAPALSFLMLGDYEFELRTTDNAGATSTDRVIIRSGATALPVNWIYFTGRTDKEGNILSWATDGENKNSYFEVERSSDGTSYSAVAKINGAGTTLAKQTYSFTDKNASPEKYFYRLKQVSTNGSISYSTVVVLGNKSSNTTIDFYPNPVKTDLSLTINNSLKGNTTIRIYGIDGKLLISKQLNKDNETISTLIPVSRLTKGVYVLEVQVGDEIKETKKFIKQ